MKKLAIAFTVVLGLLAGAVAFLAGTETGLRWIVDQVRARVDTVEIGAVGGRLIGPLAVKDVSYRNADSGMQVKLGTLALDWRPGALLRGSLHVTRLRAAGIEYTPGAPAGSEPVEPAGLPELDIALPLRVQVDRLEVESLAVAGPGGAGTRLTYASLSAALDADAVSLGEINVVAEQFGIRDGRLRLGLAPALPLEASLAWRAEAPDLPVLAGSLDADGALGGFLHARVDVDRPVAAEVRGRVRDPFTDLRWALAATLLERVALDRLSPDWPAVAVQGRLDAEGDTTQARLDPDLLIAFQGKEVAVTGEAVVTQADLSVKRLTLQRPATTDTVNLAGRVQWDEGLPFSVTAEVPESVALNELSPDWPVLALQGKVAAEGDTSRVRVKPDLLAVFQDRKVSVTGDAVVTQADLSVERLTLQRPDTTDIVNLAGRVQWDEGLPFSVTAEVPESVALNELSPDWPAVTVQGEVAAEGDTGTARVRPVLLVAFQDQEVTVAGEAVATPADLTVERLTLKRPDAADTVNLAGRVRWTGALPFSVRGGWQSLQGPEPAPWSSRSGELQAEGDLRAVTARVSGVVTPPGESTESPVEVDIDARGLDGEPVVTGSVRVPFFSFGDITARELFADIDFDASGGRDSEIRIEAASLRSGERTVSGVALRASGGLAQHTLTLTVAYQDWALAGRLAGGYDSEQWRGQVERFDLVSAGEAGMAWSLKAPAGLSWSPAATELGQLCLVHAGAELCAGGRFEPGTGWTAELAAGGVPLAWAAREAPEELQIDGALSARARFESRDDAGITGEATATVNSATVEWSGEEPVTTRYRDLEFKASLDPQVLKATLDGKVEDDGVIDGELTTRDPLAGDGPLSGRLSARLPSLRLLQAFVPALGLREGSASVALNIDGTRAAPRIEGEARIEEAVADLLPLGIRLEPLNVTVRGEPGGRVRLQASAQSGGGSLSVNGELSQNQEGDWRGGIALQGDDAQLASLPVAVISGSPDLRVDIEPSGGRVTGRLDVTHAMLTPDAGHAGVTISEDIVVVSETEEPAATNPMAWYANVALDLGPDTRFSGYGVKARLAGGLEIDAPPRKPIRANGRIDIVDGSYSLYGNTFDIEQGSLIYAGGPLDNPGVDLRVGREAGEVQVSLSVSGPLVEPQLTLSSSRPMSETDKMSYLLLGRPASEASGAEAGLLLRAAASLIPGSSGQVPGYLRSTLGLDTLEVRSGVGETEGAAVELGKYLSPRLYVSYVAGFQQTVDVFRVRYDLARHWLLRAESSVQGSGGDLLYTW